METAEVLSVLENVPVVCIQRNNTPEAAMLSMGTYRALKAQLEKQGTSPEEIFDLKTLPFPDDES